MKIENLSIGIVCGGFSNEREISLKSSSDVYKTLLENKHNVVFFDMKRDSYEDLKSFLLYSFIWEGRKRKM